MKFFTKVFVSTVSVLLAVSMLSGCQDQTSAETKTTAVTTTPPQTPELVRPTTQEKMALSMVNTIFDQYEQRGGAGENAYINLKEHYNSPQSGYLWSNFSGVGMQY